MHNHWKLHLCTHLYMSPYISSGPLRPLLYHHELTGNHHKTCLVFRFVKNPVKSRWKDRQICEIARLAITIFFYFLVALSHILSLSLVFSFSSRVSATYHMHYIWLDLPHSGLEVSSSDTLSPHATLFLSFHGISISHSLFTRLSLSFISRTEENPARLFLILIRIEGSGFFFFLYLRRTRPLVSFFFCLASKRCSLRVSQNDIIFSLWCPASKQHHFKTDGLGYYNPPP